MAVDQKPTPTPQDEFSPKMHDPREAIHFVAATELVLNNRLSAETVEMLIMLAPQPTVAYNPPQDNGAFGQLIVAFAGAGAAFSKNTPIDAQADAASGGKVQIKVEDEVTKDIATAVLKRLQALIHQRNAAVSAHMKTVREKRTKLLH